MTYLQLWRLLQMRWRVIATLAILGAVLGLAWGFLSAPVFQATTQIIANVRAPEALGAAQSAADQLEPDYLSTQVDVIKSERIARLVIQRLQLGSNSDFLIGMGWKGKGSIEDFLARRIGIPLQVKPSSSLSRVIDVSYRAGNPSFAVTMSNAFAQAYVDATLDLQAQPARDNATWYQRRLGEVQRQLAVAQERLTTRQKELGISSSEGQPESEDIRLQNLSAQVAAAQGQDATAQSRSAGGAMPTILADPVIGNLQTELAKLEAQRNQLATISGPNNPDYKQVVAQISALQRQISEQKSRLSTATRVAAQQASQAVSSLSSAVEAQKRRAIDARAQHDELGVLEQDVRNLQTVYDQMAARRAQLDLLGESTQSNMTILSPASPPERAIWPRKGLMAIMGLTLGGVFGLLLVVVREMIDQRLRASSDYEAWLGIPDLGTLRLEVPEQRSLVFQAVKLLPFYRTQE